MQALTQKHVNFEGEHFRFKDVPMELTPFQKPHPPLWYGVVNPDSAGRAAKAGMSFISNAPAAAVRAKIERYIGTERPSGCAAPKFGMNRYMVIADTDDEALAIARRAYRVWYASFMHLWWKHNQKPPNVNYPPEIDEPDQDRHRRRWVRRTRCSRRSRRSLRKSAAIIWCAASRSAI